MAGQPSPRLTSHENPNNKARISLASITWKSSIFQSSKFRHQTQGGRPEKPGISRGPMSLHLDITIVGAPPWLNLPKIDMVKESFSKKKTAAEEDKLKP